MEFHCLKEFLAKIRGKVLKTTTTKAGSIVELLKYYV